MNRKIRELTDANRKIAEYDNKITVLSQEIERLIFVREEIYCSCVH